MLRSDRVALVTGAASRIGRSVAARLATDGHRLAQADLRPCGDPDEFLCDMSRPDEVERLAAWVLRRYGRCDLLINGAARDATAPLDLATWRQVQAVNLDAAYQLCAAFAPGMTELGYGRIINLLPAAPARLATAASRAGLIGLTRSLAVELGDHGITVNAVARSTPADTAALIGFLASDEAALITGQTLHTQSDLIAL